MLGGGGAGRCRSLVGVALLIRYERLRKMWDLL